MTAWICRTCAVQYADTDAPPERCVICTDDRQYVGADGQRWTTLTELAGEGHRVEISELEPGLYGLTTAPKLAIGQTAQLVTTDAGNLLWDPTGYLDESAIGAVRDLGGIAAVASSHPHMYGVMAEWSAAFGGAPILVNEHDRDWVTRPEPSVELWRDRRDVLPGVTLVRTGGHFPGSGVAVWSAGADGRGVLLAGDSIMVAPDRGWVSFMRSYPNLLPLSARAVRAIVERLDGVEFDRIYSNFGQRVEAGGQDAIRRSADRYLAWITGEHDDLIG